MAKKRMTKELFDGTIGEPLRIFKGLGEEGRKSVKKRRKFR